MNADHSIRFINSNYDELFRIPDGGKIKVDFPDRSFVSPCKYIDDYHTEIGGNVYHICQFAEILERGNGKASPEPEILKEQAAWQVTHDNYLMIQSIERGFAYAACDRNFNAIDGGLIHRTDITIRECRDALLEKFGWQHRNFKEVDVDMVETRITETVSEQTDSLLKQLQEKSKANDFRGTDDAKKTGSDKLAKSASPRKKSEECL